MTVYVDPLRSNGWKLRGHPVRNCHLFTDGDLGELHALADRIGMRRAWFQVSARSSVPHYDLTPPRRVAAIAAGAVEVDRREAARIWRHIREVESARRQIARDAVAALCAPEPREPTCRHCGMPRPCACW